VRGVIGEGLTPEVASRFAAALGTYVHGGPVILCRDSRPSGAMLSSAATAGLLSVGCRVIDSGIAPTPTCGVAVRAFAAAGGLQITASHTRHLERAKAVRAGRCRPVGAEGEKVRGLYESGQFRRVAWNNWERGSTTRTLRPHREAVLRLVDVERIRQRHIPVFLDGNGGAGGEAGVDLCVDSAAVTATPANQTASSATSRSRSPPT